VKTKTKHTVVEIVGADDLFDLVSTQSFLPKFEEQEVIQIEDKLKKFLCLDQNYQDLIMIKKLSKAFAEIE